MRHRAEGQRARNGTMRQGDVSLVDVAAREESRRAADIGRKRREGESEGGVWARVAGHYVWREWWHHGWDLGMGMCVGFVVEPDDST